MVITFSFLDIADSRIDSNKIIKIFVALTMIWCCNKLNFRLQNSVFLQGVRPLYIFEFCDLSNPIKSAT